MHASNSKDHVQDGVSMCMHQMDKFIALSLLFFLKNAVLRKKSAQAFVATAQACALVRVARVVLSPLENKSSSSQFWTN